MGDKRHKCSVFSLCVCESVCCAAACDMDEMIYETGQQEIECVLSERKRVCMWVWMLKERVYEHVCS